MYIGGSVTFMAEMAKWQSSIESFTRGSRLFSGGPIFTLPGGGWLLDANAGEGADEDEDEDVAADMGKTDLIMLVTGLNKEGGGADGAGDTSLNKEEDDEDDNDENDTGPEGGAGAEEVSPKPPGVGWRPSFMAFTISVAFHLE